MRRIERLINLIAALLETPRPLSADDIRRNVAGYDQANHEAFRRAFERDKEALRAMGIPLELRPSPDDPLGEQLDAYIIPKDRYYLPDIDLEPDEVTALRLAADAVLGAGDEVESGLLKLSMDAPSSSLGTPRVAWGADVTASEPSLAGLYGALLERAPVRFTYRAASGEERERRVEPYGLVHRRGSWYLVGRDRDREAVRSFKVSRVVSDVASEPGNYEIPNGFDAAEHLAGEPFEIGSEEPALATVRFSATLRWWAEQNLDRGARSEGPDGSLDVELPVANTSALVSWALGFGDEIEILEPPEARAALKDHLAPWLVSERT